MGDKFLIVLIIEYACLAIAYLWQKNYPKALYFTGAIILSLGVLWAK